jgi:hypothetical protein
MNSVNTNIWFLEEVKVCAGQADGWTDKLRRHVWLLEEAILCATQADG